MAGLAGERDDRRIFLTLDGLRGVAAVFVAMRHTSFFHGLGIHGGYLAVDLFFVLSGFVIAHAYEQRLAQGLSAGRFVAMRYLRLWPVYGLGAVLGLIAAVTHTLPGRDNMPLDDVARTAPFALAMLPGPHIKPMLYPVNSVAWSLALEIMINAIYAFAWRPLRDPRVLSGVLAVSAATLAAACWYYGKLDVGFMWTDVWGGLPRVVFSFTAGLAVYRLYRAATWRLKIPAWTTLAVLAPLLWIKVDEIVYPLICVVAIFPALVYAAATSRPSPRTAPLYAWLGAVSFPLYALHKPAGEMTTYAVRHLWPQAAHLGPWIGVPYLLALLGACALVERAYDRPVRRMLTGGLNHLAAITKMGRGAGETGMNADQLVGGDLRNPEPQLCMETCRQRTPVNDRGELVAARGSGAGRLAHARARRCERPAQFGQGEPAPGLLLHGNTGLQAVQQNLRGTVVEKVVGAGHALEADRAKRGNPIGQPFGRFDRREIVLIAVDDVNRRGHPA